MDNDPIPKMFFVTTMNVRFLRSTPQKIHENFDNHCQPVNSDENTEVRVKIVRDDHSRIF